MEILGISPNKGRSSSRRDGEPTSRDVKGWFMAVSVRPGVEYSRTGEVHMRKNRISFGAAALPVLLAIAVAAQQGATEAGGLRSFEIVPLEKVSETSSNASIGDVNEDGKPDIVLVKGRHWQVTTLTFFGDGRGTLHRDRRFRAMP